LKILLDLRNSLSRPPSIPGLGSTRASVPDVPILYLATARTGLVMRGRAVSSFQADVSTLRNKIVPTLRQFVLDAARIGRIKKLVRPFLLSLLLVATATICLVGLSQFAELPHVSIVYLIPVLISATRWGVFPAVVAAIASIAASAYFFYPPIYSLEVHNPLQLLDLVLFVCVAVVTGQLANNLRRHVEAARQRENDIRALYSFSRQLAVASSASEIYAAIQQHLNEVLGKPVLLFDAMPEVQQTEERDGHHALSIVREAIANATNVGASAEVTVLDSETGASWLIRAVSQKTPDFGTAAVEIGRKSDRASDAIRRRVDSVLDDAAATLERLDIARALGEAKMRAEAETFRDALIGSVSHELRTPLASIVGSTYVLANAPGLKQDTRLAALADDVRHEAERLNDDIQNLLDSTRITSAGIRPQLQWADVSDIVNAAVERRQLRLSSHTVERDFQDDLPLVHADPALVEQALGQILDNAAKYAPADSSIRLVTRGRGGEVSIAVADQGAGLAAEEQTRIWERFYRSPRHQATTTGFGLGLWIARAFVVATGGRIEATSSGAGRGTTVTIHLPAPQPTSTTDELGSSDE
jgi:two-component system sensor histidine kinase KdpD